MYCLGIDISFQYLTLFPLTAINACNPIHLRRENSVVEFGEKDYSSTNNVLPTIYINTLMLEFV